GSAEKALPFYEQALAMRRRLYPEAKYPDGHPELAASLDRMGSVLHSAGSAEKALPFYERALAMHRRLYPHAKNPDPHPPPPPTPPHAHPHAVWRSSGRVRRRRRCLSTSGRWPCAAGSTRRRSTPTATPTSPPASTSWAPCWTRPGRRRRRCPSTSRRWP